MRKVKFPQDWMRHKCCIINNTVVFMKEKLLFSITNIVMLQKEEKNVVAKYVLFTILKTESKHKYRMYSLTVTTLVSLRNILANKLHDKNESFLMHA